MEVKTSNLKEIDAMQKKKCRPKFNLRNLRLSLKYRPDILKLVLKMRQCIQKKSLLLKKVKLQLKLMENIPQTDNSTQTESDLTQTNNDGAETDSITNSLDYVATKVMEVDENSVNKDTKDSSTQTEDIPNTNSELNKVKLAENSDKVKENDHTEKAESKKEDAGWNVSKSDEKGKSIAEQVKEAAQSALQQSGMVYVESAGMYYDYKTGYYYNSELGLYYHTNTGCYYYYSDEKQEFVFHSYPDRKAVAANAALEAHEKRKAKKHKKAWKTEEEIDNLTKNLSKDKEDGATKPKRKKKSDKQKIPKENTNKDENKDNKDENKESKTDAEDSKTDTEKETSEVTDSKEDEELKEKENKTEQDLEDGECSETASDDSDGEMSDASTSTASDEDTVAKHHPPCMRVIVRETNLPKLKVGSLFLVTKDGGTVGREGDQHTILLKDHNVSRNHLDIRYDMERRMYVAMDLGSKNGTMLNGIQMSESQVKSKPMEVMHGSTIQLGETKLLCHIHAGNDTCGHCEPGLLIETEEKEKVAYTRIGSVQKQYQLELARLKNKYAPEPLMIEDGAYNDRAKARREAVGSSHHSEKTQTTDMETSIAPENKGFKLLEKMGWSKGEGLGKDNQGEVDPIPLVSNEGKAGLGTPGAAGPPIANPLPKKRNTLGPATLRLATRSKLLQPPAKAFLDPSEEDDDKGV